MNIIGLFPEEYRAFCHGPLSVRVERYGGIKSISTITSIVHDGKFYPDNKRLSVFSQAEKILGHPVISPSIEFFHELQDGTLEQFVPENADLWPDGFQSKEYSMKLCDDGLRLRFRKTVPGRFLCRIRKSHIGSICAESHKNQPLYLYSCVCRLSEDGLKAEGIDVNKPFYDKGTREQKFNEAIFDSNIFCLSFSVKEQAEPYSMKCRITADRQLVFVDNSDTYDLYADLPANASISLGMTLSNAENALQKVLKMPVSQDLYPAFRLEIPEIDQAGIFSVEYLNYQFSMLFDVTRREACLRAANDSFAFFVLWDHIYSIRDFIMEGYYQIAEKLIRYICTYPQVEIFIWITTHISITLNEYLSHRPDSKLLGELWPYLKAFGEKNLRDADPETGLVATGYSCGNDNSTEVGLDTKFYASCINGWWYDSCRVMENFAFEMNEPDLAHRFGETAARLERAYETYFLDKDTGYLLQAINLNKRPPAISVFQNSNTLALDYVHGMALFRKYMGALAHYQKTKLYHPTGHRAIASDSAVKCDMWLAVHMNQHLGHECKLARMGGYPQEAVRVMQGYMQFFEKYKTAIETFNIAGCIGNQGQNAKWQAFSATGAMQALVKGIVGIDWHRGGLFYVPAEENAPRKLSVLPWRSMAFEITVTGTGNYAAMKINGKSLTGSLQIPADFPMKKENAIRIVRSNKLVPMLLRSLDLPIVRLAADANRVAFEADADSHAPTWLLAPSRPLAVLLDGKAIPYEWNKDSLQVYVDPYFKKGSKFEMVLK